jgi:hypothetical protein
MPVWRPKLHKLQYQGAAKNDQADKTNLPRITLGVKVV